MEAVNVKEHARKIVDDLKEDSTWDDLMQKIYIRQAIEAGLADSMAGRTTDVHDIRKNSDCPNESPLDKHGTGSPPRTA